MIFKIAISICILTLCCIHEGHAALKLKGSVSIEEGYNPKPAQDDILLPMPCDASMAFKLVAVPAKGFLWDMTTRFGRDDAQNAERAYYDSRHTNSLSAPFSHHDLPAAWQKLAPEGDFYYYLMAKYEVSGLQWDSLMEQSCPAVSTENIRPKTNISWYDATMFSEKYTNWLLQNAPEALPRFISDTRNVGYVRLPTETEWEYAAKGGHTTTSQQLLENDFFPIAQGTSFEEYAVFRPENASRIEEHPLGIGSRKPNNLGLYDTAGNAAEMVLDVFRFSLGGRLHGSAGGFIRKGGSFLAGTDEILPGRREESPFFYVDGPATARDLGFRLAISGINTPGGNRPEQLQAEWKQAGESSELVLHGANNTLEAIDRFIATARSNEEKINYQTLRNIIKDNNINLERQQMLAASSEIRNATFMIESIRNFSSRIKIVSSTLKSLQRQNEEARKKGLKNNTEKHIATAKKGIMTLESGLEQSINFYRTKLQDTQNIATDIFNAAYAQVQAELQKGDGFNTDLYENLLIYAHHTQAVRNKEFKAITAEQIKKDILN